VLDDRLSVCFAAVHPSVNIYFTRRDICVLGGGISMKFPAVIHHVSGYCWKGFQVCDEAIKMRILTFKIRRMQIDAFILSVGMIVTICYFLKSVKSVFILVHCNTSLSKNFVAHSITVVVIGWIWKKKNRFFCILWLSVHMKSVVEQGFSRNSHLTTTRLKHSSNFESVENIRTLSNSNSNFVTSLFSGLKVKGQCPACKNVWSL